MGKLTNKIDVRNIVLTDKMLPNLKKETEEYTGKDGEFLMDYCIKAETHNLVTEC